MEQNEQINVNEITETDVLRAVRQSVRELIVATTQKTASNTFTIRCVNGQTFEVAIRSMDR